MPDPNVPQKEQLKFLPIPSLISGLCLGFNNFLLGLISNKGISSLYIFSVGALLYVGVYRLIEAIKNKIETGHFISFEKSNLFESNKGVLKLKWVNVGGLILRSLLNISFQISLMMAFMFAERAHLNQGLVTAFLSTYCVFTSIIFYLVFDEILRPKFVLGIALMISCVLLVSFSTHSSAEAADSTKQHHHSNALICFSFSLMAPLMISCFISVSRHWTMNFGYSSFDFTIDTFTVMGLVEIPFFINYHLTHGYSMYVFMAGIGAAFG